MANKFNADDPEDVDDDTVEAWQVAIEPAMDKVADVQVVAREGRRESVTTDGIQV